MGTIACTYWIDKPVVLISLLTHAVSLSSAIVLHKPAPAGSKRFIRVNVRTVFYNKIIDHE